MTIKSGRAEPQLGKDDSPREKDSAYYSRGYIPHFNQPGALQSITYRLEDSLPAHVVERLNTEFAARSDDNLDIKKRIRIQHLLDAGLGSCILQHPDAAQLVVDTWKRLNGERYDLIEWGSYAQSCACAYSRISRAITVENSPLVEELHWQKDQTSTDGTLW